MKLNVYLNKESEWMKSKQKKQKFVEFKIYKCKEITELTNKLNQKYNQKRYTCCHSKMKASPLIRIQSTSFPPFSCVGIQRIKSFDGILKKCVLN